MFIQEVPVHEFRNRTAVHFGPFAAPTQKSDIIVLAGANGGGKSSVLELVSYAFSSAFGFNYGNRRPLPNKFRFEVSIGMTSDELRLIRKYLDENRSYNYRREALTKGTVSERSRADRLLVKMSGVDSVVPDTAQSASKTGQT